MTDLLLPRGSTKYKEQVQKLLDSQPAVKKDRAGELALGNSFLGLPGTRSCLPARGAGPAQKPGGGGRGRGEMARGGGRLRPEKPGRPGNSKNATLPARESFCAYFWHFLCVFFCICFCIFFAFFLHFQTRSHFFCIFVCISQTGSHFLGTVLHFPNRESFFAFFCISLDRVCHLHRLPDPYEKTTRKWTMLESRKRQENDNKMTRKWQRNYLTNDKKMTKTWQNMTPQNRNDKKCKNQMTKKWPKKWQK